MFSFFETKKIVVGEIDSIFSFLASLTKNPDVIENNLMVLKKIKKTYKGSDQIFVEHYLNWEDLIVSNQPSNSSQPQTKEKIRQNIRNEVEINNIDSSFRLIFLDKRSQALFLYEEYAISLVQYIGSNMGEESVKKDLEHLRNDSFLAKIIYENGTINFEIANKAIIPNTIDYPLDSITKSFKYMVGVLYNTIEVSFGEKVTQDIFYNYFNKTRQIYNSEFASILLKIIPERILGFNEWLSMLSKSELEKEVLEKTRALEELNASLEKNVNERIKELKKAYEDLKKLDEQKSDFISLAAHQLRTPLSGIKWTLNMLKNGDLGEIKKDQLDLIEKAYETNDRVINIINTLLDIEHIRDNKETYAFQKVNLMEIISDAVRDTTAQTKKKNIIITEPSLPKEASFINADPEKIHVILLNLIDNAIKYSKTNGKIVIDARKVNGQVEIIIKDNGIGIDEKDKENIFKRFYRADNAIREVTEGSGLGLFITKHIIEDHGGRIWFDSAVNEGTTFHISIPIVPNKEGGGMRDLLDNNINKG